VGRTNHAIQSLDAVRNGDGILFLSLTEVRNVEPNGGVSITEVSTSLGSSFSVATRIVGK
jgi:hypothetical protein